MKPTNVADEHNQVRRARDPAAPVSRARTLHALEVAETNMERSRALLFEANETMIRAAHTLGPYSQLSLPS